MPTPNHPRQTRSRPGALAAFAALIAMAALATLAMTPAVAVAAPTGPDGPKRVLPKGVETKIEAAFGRAGPAWKLETAKVDKDRVQAKVCDAAGACHSLALSDPKAACKGKTVGPWCLTWSAAAPAEAASLEAALAKDSDATMWKTIAARPKQPAIAAPGGGTATDGPAAEEGGDHHDGEGPGEQGEDDTTLLLVIALVSAAAATFALFKLRDDEDEGEGGEGGQGGDAA